MRRALDELRVAPHTYRAGALSSNLERIESATQANGRTTIGGPMKKLKSLGCRSRPICQPACTGLWNCSPNPSSAFLRRHMFRFRRASVAASKINNELWLLEAMRRRESDMSKGKNRQGTSGPNSELGPGVPAPDFKLRSTQSLRPDRETGAPGAQAPDIKLQTLPPDQFISLSELRGRPVSLAFYPADWSPVYGAYRQQDGISERALFVIDADGTIRWSYLSPLDVNPGAEGILDALEALVSKREVAA